METSISKNRQAGKVVEFVKNLVWVTCFMCLTTQSATLPSGLSQSEILKLTHMLGLGSATRLHRSAENYVLFPGFKLGFEVVTVFSSNLGGLGLQNGTVPTVLPVPRVYLAKGLGPAGEIIVSALPVSLQNGLSTIGGGWKMEVLSEKDADVSIALFGLFTWAQAFAQSLQTQVIEGGGLLSKDWVRIKPFLGLGMAFARGEVQPSFATGPNIATGLNSHFFIGAEFDLPFNLSVQFDAFNLQPGASLLFAGRF